VVVGIGGSRTAALTRHSVLVLTWLAVALLRPGLAAAASADPDGVVIAYATARKSGDTEAMLALFADNAVIIDRLGYPHTGRAEVRRMLQISSSRGRQLGVTDARVSGDHVSWIEPTATPLLNLAAAVEADVEGGRITRLVYRNDATVQADQPRVGDLLPAPLGMIVPLLVAGLSVTALWLGSQPVARAALPRLGLLDDLRRWSHARQAGRKSSARTPRFP
jgi:hypothetical protein